VSTCTSTVELNHKVIQGLYSSHPLIIRIIQDTRADLLRTTAKFQKEHPELEEKAGRKKTVKVQPAQASPALTSIQTFEVVSSQI